MSYKVYYTEAGATEAEMHNLSMHIPVEFISKETAMAWAFDASKKGATILRIEGPGGFVMTQAEFEKKYSGCKG
jgi:hypothetical protein